MHNTESSVVFTRAYTVFKTLLMLYPESYRKRFGQEMLIIFEDMYQEEIAKGKIGIGFWLSLFADTLQSIVREHNDMIKKQGVKNYFRISTYNIIGGILLLPFVTLLCLDIIGRLVQGDFYHYNRAWYVAISQSVLYKEPVLLQIVFIFGPLLAVLLNVIPFLNSLKKIKKVTLRKLIFANPLAVLIIGLGFLCLLIAYGHDAVPCFVHGLVRVGIGQLPQIISVCKNA